MSEKNALYANVSINIFTKIKKFSLSEQFSSQFRCLLTASNFIQKDSIETVIPLEPLNSLVVAPLIFLRSLLCPSDLPIATRRQNVQKSKNECLW